MKQYSLLIKAAIVVLLFVAAIVYMYTTYWTSPTMTVGEIRIYVVTFILLCLFMTGAMLRLYNAVVGNTRFVIKLQQEVVKLISSLTDNTREQKDSASTYKRESTSLKIFLERTTTALDTLRNKIADILKL